MFRLASIACGVVVAVNVVVASRIYGEVVLHTGDVVDLKLMDANYGSIPIVFGMALALEQLSGERLWRWATAGLAVALAIMAYGLLILASRGAQTAAAVVIGLWGLRLFFIRRPHLGFASRIGATLVVVGVAWLLAASVGGELLSRNGARWDEAVASGGSDRVEIYSGALDVAVSRPLSTLVGGGVGHNLDVLEGRSAHNQVLDTLFDYGILGLLSIGWLWFSFVAKGPFGRARRGAAADSTVLPAIGLGICALWLAPIWFTFAWIEIAYLSACVASRMPATAVRRIRMDAVVWQPVR